MGYNYYQRQRGTTNTDVGQDVRFDELGMYGLYQSPHHESSFLVNQLDNAGQVMLAARREPEFDENGLEISGTGDTELDAYWINASLRTTQARNIDPVDLADEDLSGFPLEAQEHIKGLQTERRRHREKALAADLLGIDRASRCRTSVETEFSNRRAEVASRLIDSEPGLTRFSPLDELEEDQVAAVRDAAASAVETLVTPPKIEVLEHRIAARVLTGQDVFTAVSNVLDALYQEAGVIQPISSVPAVPSKYDVEADIQGEVVTLWDPKATNQQQVGLIEDETGRIKFTVWLRSNQGVILREGDLVRMRAGKVGKYRGEPTLVADSQTLITAIEKGDGPALRRPSFDSPVPTADSKDGNASVPVRFPHSPILASLKSHFRRIALVTGEMQTMADSRQPTGSNQPKSTTRMVASRSLGGGRTSRTRFASRFPPMPIP